MNPVVSVCCLVVCLFTRQDVFLNMTVGVVLSKDVCCGMCDVYSNVVLVHSLEGFLNRTAGGGLSKDECCVLMLCVCTHPDNSTWNKTKTNSKPGIRGPRGPGSQCTRLPVSSDSLAHLDVWNQVLSFCCLSSVLLFSVPEKPKQQNQTHKTHLVPDILDAARCRRPGSLGHWLPGPPWASDTRF